MKIKTQFILTMILFGAVLLAVSASVLLTNQRVSGLRAQEALAGDIERAAAELSYLTDDFLLHGEAQQRARWDSEWASISKRISNLSPDTNDQRAIVENMRRSHLRLKRVFDEAAADIGGQGVGALKDPVSFQVSWSRMAVQTQVITFDALRLSRIMRSQVDEARAINTILAVALVAILLAFFTANYLLVTRRTLGALSELAKGTSIVGLGDLDHVIPVRRRDEIGDVADSFNVMTAGLRRVTASKADLEREVKERQQAEDALRKNEERLRAIVDEIPIGIALFDPTGSVLVVNEANRHIWGLDFPVTSSVGEYVVHGVSRHSNEQPMQPDDWPVVRTIATGEQVEDLVDITGSDQTTLTARMRTVPVKDDQGAVVHIISISEDVTELLERKRLDDALMRLTSTMGATLDVREIGNQLMTLGMEALGTESSAVSMREGDRWVVRGVLGLPDSSVGTVLTDDELGPSLLAVREGRTIAVDDVENDDSVDSNAQRPFGSRSFMAIPLVAQGCVLGVAAFHYQSRPVAFSASQLEFGAKLMAAASLALQNALLYEREHHIADMLQGALLSPPEKIEGLQTAVIYRPALEAANVGGDFYDVFRIDADRVGILIGDVSGKGLEAAQLTSLARDGIRAYAYENRDPGQVVQRVNHLFALSSGAEMFVTLFFGILDVATGALEYCSAGHPPPVVARPDGSAVVLAAGSPLAGAFDGLIFETDKVELASEDVLVLFTDGLTEARRRGELYGDGRVLDSVRELAGTPVENLPQSLLEGALTFSEGGLRDDTVILCLRRSNDSA